MKTSLKLGALALASGAVALASTASAGNHEDMEKCYGVVKAGMNDCASASGSHSCAGQASVDGDAGEWLLVPAGTCERLAGGSLEGK